MKRWTCATCDTTQETLLEDACEVVEKIMKCDPNEWCFSIMALVPKKDQQMIKY